MWRRMEIDFADLIEKNKLFNFLFLERDEEKSGKNYMLLLDFFNGVHVEFLNYVKDEILKDSKAHDQYVAFQCLTKYTSLIKIEPKDYIKFMLSIISTKEEVIESYEFKNSFGDYTLKLEKKEDIKYLFEQLKEDKSLISLLPILFMSASRNQRELYFNELEAMLDNGEENHEPLITESIFHYPENNDLLERKVTDFLKRKINNEVNKEHLVKNLNALVYLTQFKEGLFDIIIDESRQNDNYYCAIIECSLDSIRDYYSNLPIILKKFFTDKIANHDFRNATELRKLQLTLHSLCIQNKLDEVEYLLDNVKKNGNLINIKELGSLAHFVASDIEKAGHLITKWFLSGDSVCVINAVNLCKEIPAEKIILNDVFLEEAKNKNKLIPLSKIICGWLFEHPRKATKLVMIICDKGSNKDKKEISEIFDHFLYENFPKIIGEYLKDLESFFESPEMKKIIKDMIYDRDQRELLVVKARDTGELYCSSNEAQADARKKMQEMDEIFESADEKSIFSSLFGDKLVLLYGDSTVVHSHSIGGEKMRQEIPLSSIPFEHEEPKMLTYDPIGLEQKYVEYRSQGINK